VFAAGSDLGADVDALLRVFWSRAACTPPGAQFAAITPAGSRLDTFAAQHGFRSVFHLPADIGERFAALSYPGILTTALIGGDPSRLVERAQRMLLACRPEVRADQNPGVSLGILLATLAARRVDKVTLQAADRLHALPDWLELLLATFAEGPGRGAVPITAEPRATAAELAKDRLLVHLRASDPKAKPLAALGRAGHPCVSIRLHDAYDLGGEFVRWQLATIVACHLAGVDPFETSAAAEIGRAAGRLVDTPPPARAVPVDAPALADCLTLHLRPVRGTGHAAVHAFFAPTPRRDRLLHDLRLAFRKRLGVTTTLGYGTRQCLASARLSLSGPPPTAACILTANASDDVLVPGGTGGLAELQQAHALALEEALIAHDRPVLRLHLGAGIERGLQRLLATVQKLRLAPPPAKRAAPRAAGRRR
jgi:hypothetical protein